MRKREVVKASGVLHISHTVSLLQQQLWNILLAYAYPDFEKKDQFQLPLSRILSYLSADGQYEWGHVVKALNGLSVKVEYNLFRKDRNSKWGIFHLLEDVCIEDGICFYSYAPAVRNAVNSSVMFARINLAIQRKFRCKYSLFLYELAVDYRGLKGTPWFDLKLFRKYMGLQQNEYVSFKLLNFHVVRKAIQEINQKSDLQLAVQLDCVAREVKAIRFFIQEKEVAAGETHSPVPLLPVAEDQTLIDKLLSYGLSKKKATEIIEAFSSDIIEHKVKIMLESKQKIKNTGAWLLKALKEGWNVKEYSQATEKEKVRKDTLQKHQKEQALEKKLRDLQCEHDMYKNTKVEQLYQTLPESMIDYVEETFKPWLAEQRKKAGIFALSEDFYKKMFLRQFLIDKKEQDFVQWALARGYRVKKDGNKLQLLE